MISKFLFVDPKVLMHGFAIAKKRGDSLIGLTDFSKLRPDEVLTIVAHGDDVGGTIAGMTAKDFADMLRAGGFKGCREIELVVCNAGTGKKVGAELFAELGVPVRAPKGTVNAIDHGDLGVPRVRDPNSGQFLPEGDGWELFNK